jgi:poly(3-hydroxybutyrate) depolymerase
MGVPTVLGLILIAAAAADGHELCWSARDDGWWLPVRMDLESLGGFWLLGGLAPRWARTSALCASAGLLIFDLARTLAGEPPRPIFGRVAAGPWWVLAGDLATLAALMCWRPAAGRVAWIEAHPRRLAGAVLIAVAAGIAADRSQIGRFPIVATARSGGPSSPRGTDYLVYLPDGYYRPFGRWPLILALHGSGAVGDEIDRVRREGLPRRLEERRAIPFIVVAPQSSRYGWDVEALDRLLDEVLRQYRVDADRVYLTGHSMGGYGAWALASTHPGRFAAIAPICGGGDSDRADRLRIVPTWAFHGADDRVILPEESRRMVAAVERAGGDARLTIYPSVGHDVWSITYADPGFYDWLLAHRRRSPAR